MSTVRMSSILSKKYVFISNFSVCYESYYYRFNTSILFSVLFLCCLSIVCFLWPCYQGSHASLKVVDFLVKFPVLESHWKWFWSWKVLEFAGRPTQWWRHGRENIHICTPLVFVIHSYRDKTFFLLYMRQWWTLQYGCYCHTLICRVSNCCLCLYLHVARDYNKVLENTFVFLQSPGIYFQQVSGKLNPVLWH